MAMGGMGGWHIAASFRRDRSVLQQTLPKGTLRRIVRFAATYRRQLAWFLVLVVLDAAIGAVNPLLYRAIIDKGIPSPGRAGRGARRGRRRAGDPGRRRVARQPLVLRAHRRGPDLRHAVRGVRPHPADAD